MSRAQAESKVLPDQKVRPSALRMQAAPKPRPLPNRRLENSFLVS